MIKSNKTPISVVVITKNEAKRIRECIESVKWANEIIILDSFSDDKTVEIAREYTDKVFQREWTNEGAHRNYAYSLASNEWVLSLDADERITEELRLEIEEKLEGGTDSNGFTIPRKNYIGKHWLRYGGWYPSAQLRLFRKDKFKYEEVDVHPRAFMKDPRGELKNPMIHYSYSNIEDFVNKFNNHTDREAEKWYRSGKGMTFGRAVRRTFDRFFRAYYRKGGKNDGVYGFIAALFGGLYQILSFGKYWEKGLKWDVPSPMSRPAKPDKGDIKNRKKISAVIIAKNEEKLIENCLKSLMWTDEVVVVDGFSTDKTVDICKRYGAKVVEHKFEGDFGLERNIGNENSTGDWILQLDADEIVTEAFREKAMEILKEDNGFNAYKFLRKNFFMGRFMRHGGWYHYSHHFFKKGKAHYDGRVHHQLVVQGKIGTLPRDVEHYPFQNISQLIRRQNRYTTIEAEEMLELKGRIDDKEILYNIKVKPFKLFWKFFVKKKGFLEGFHGLFFSILFSIVHFLKWAKYWELVQNPEAR